MDINNVKNIVSGLIKNTSKTEKIEYIGFIMSLCPVPGIEQAGSIIEKIAGNKALNEKFDSIMSSIEDANIKINDLTDTVEKFKEINKTVKQHKEILQNIQSLITSAIEELKNEHSDFIVDTSNWGIQHLIDTNIDTDFLSISAIDNSENLLRNTKITSPHTHLIANNHSKNIIEKGEFKDINNSVSMNNITQSGNISITGGNSIGFGENGCISFGVPDILKANCPKCSYLIETTRLSLIGKSSITCPNCGESLSFRIN